MKNQNLPIFPIIFISIIFTAVLFLISLYFQNQQPLNQIENQMLPASGTPIDSIGATPQVFISPAPKEEKNNAYQ